MDTIELSIIGSLLATIFVGLVLLTLSFFSVINLNVQKVNNKEEQKDVLETPELS